MPFSQVPVSCLDFPNRWILVCWPIDCTYLFRHWQRLQKRLKKVKEIVIKPTHKHSIIKKMYIFALALQKQRP